MKYLFFFILGLSSNLLAETFYYAPTAIGGAGPRTFYQSLIHAELKGWARPETGTSVRLESGCGVDVEFHLLGNHRKNYLLLGITNSNTEPVIIKNREVKFIMDGQKERYPDFNHHFSDNRIQGGWWSINWLPFPSKEEFKKLKNLEVNIPVLNEKTGEVCIVRTTFLKTKKIESETISYSAFEFLLDGGGALGQSGNIEKLGKGGGMVAFEFNFFPRPQSGWGVVFSNETGFKDSDTPEIYQKFEKDKNYQANIGYLGLQYVYRYFLSKTLSLQYTIGPGYQSVEDSNENDVNNIKGSGWALSQKLALNWRLGQWFLPTYETLDFFTGVGVVQYYTPGLKINGEQLDGHRFAGLLRIGVSF